MTQQTPGDRDPHDAAPTPPPYPDAPGPPASGEGYASGGQPYPPAPEGYGAPQEGYGAPQEGYTAPQQGYSGGYTEAPGYPVAGTPLERPTGQPPPLALAVKLMYAGTVLSLISLLVSFTQGDAIREQLEGQPGMTPDAIDAAVAVGFVFGVVFGLIGVALWILNAIFNARGKKWARILSTVLGAIAVLAFLASFLQTSTAPTMILGLLQALLAAVIIWLLWRPDSSRYYQAMSAPRY